MQRSISNRIQRSFFAIYTISVLTVLVVAWLFLENLEEVTLAIDKQVEFEHFSNRVDPETAQHINSANLILSYLPAQEEADNDLPIIFKDLPIPYDGELEFLDDEYLIIIDQSTNGTYYLAKNLALFQKHEDFMIKVFLLIALLAIIFGYLLSIFFSRMISNPITQLNNDINNINSDQSILPSDYKDLELQQISTSFNRSLADMNAFMQRERSMIAMASHELRSPIAVILGAAEVIDRRNNLQNSDKITLARIINSASLMSDNINALLSLSRHKKIDQAKENFSLNIVIESVIQEIINTHQKYQNRIIFNPLIEVKITEHKGMIWIVLRNLITNGLIHNVGDVSIKITENSIEVLDQGIENISLSQLDSEKSTGLGLYIVTSICDQLGWSFSLNTSKKGSSSAIITLL